MYSPRPPAPIAAAIVADPTPTTAATRTPATIDGSASGSSTREQFVRRHPHRHARFPNRRIDPVDAGNRRSNNRQESVQDQDDDGRTGADATDERHGEKKS